MEVLGNSPIEKFKYFLFLILDFLGLRGKSPAAIIECCDPRLLRDEKRLLLFLKVDMDHCTRIILAGSAKDIAEAIAKKKDACMSNLRTAFGKHELKKVFIMFHNDCGGYEESDGMKEIVFQIRDSLVVGDYISENWEGIEVFYLRQRLTGRRIELTLMTREEVLAKLAVYEKFRQKATG